MSPEHYVVPLLGGPLVNPVVILKDTVTRGELEGLRPDTGRMAGLERTGRVKGVILSLLSEDSNYHFFSRYFAPW